MGSHDFTINHVREHFDSEHRTYLAVVTGTPARIETEDNSQLDDYFAISGDALARLRRGGMVADRHVEQSDP